VFGILGRAPILGKRKKLKRRREWLRGKHSHCLSKGVLPIRGEIKGGKEISQQRVIQDSPHIGKKR